MDEESNVEESSDEMEVSPENSPIQDESEDDPRALASTSSRRPESTSSDTPDNSSDEVVSKYVFMAQNLLLTVLAEIMLFNKEMGLFRKFRSDFAKVHQSHCPYSEKSLQMDLAYYLALRNVAFKAENMHPSGDSLEYFIKKAMETLTRIVVTTLIYTVSVWSSMKLDEMMINYTTFKRLDESFEDEIETFEKIDGKTLPYDDQKFEILLFQTRIAFQLLLMHIGEYADQGFIDKNRELLFEGHLMCLERSIV